MRHLSLPPLYHVSANLFKRPSLVQVDQVAAGRTMLDERSPNGVLGLWISPHPSACSSFGQHVYQVGLSASRRDFDLPLRQLYRLQRDLDDAEVTWEQQIEFYLRKRKEWAEKCDVVHIRDASGVGEIIVVNLEVISTFKHLAGAKPEDFPIRICQYDEVWHGT